MTDERKEAVRIAVMLMERHLEMATPGGAGRDSNAYKVARGRITTLQAILDDNKRMEAALIEIAKTATWQGDLARKALGDQP